MTTNTLKEITEAASLLFKKTMNTYTLQDLTRHRAIPHKNLYEICSQYPSQGKPKYLENSNIKKKKE